MKKILSVMLALAMLISLGVSALAIDEEEYETATVAEIEEAGAVPGISAYEDEGDKYVIVSYEGEPTLLVDAAGDPIGDATLNVDVTTTVDDFIWGSVYAGGNTSLTLGGNVNAESIATKDYTTDALGVYAEYGASVTVNGVKVSGNGYGNQGVLVTASDEYGDGETTVTVKNNIVAGGPAQGVNIGIGFTDDGGGQASVTAGGVEVSGDGTVNLGVSIEYSSFNETGSNTEASKIEVNADSIAVSGNGDPVNYSCNVGIDAETNAEVAVNIGGGDSAMTVSGKDTSNYGVSACNGAGLAFNGNLDVSGDGSYNTGIEAWDGASVAFTGDVIVSGDSIYNTGIEAWAPAESGLATVTLDGALNVSGDSENAGVVLADGATVKAADIDVTGGLAKGAVLGEDYGGDGGGTVLYAANVTAASENGQSFGIVFESDGNAAVLTSLQAGTCEIVLFGEGLDDNRDNLVILKETNPDDEFTAGTADFDGGPDDGEMALMAVADGEPNGGEGDGDEVEVTQLGGDELKSFLQKCVYYFIEILDGDGNDAQDKVTLENAEKKTVNGDRYSVFSLANVYDEAATDEDASFRITPGAAVEGVQFDSKFSEMVENDDGTYTVTVRRGGDLNITLTLREIAPNRYEFDYAAPVYQHAATHTFSASFDQDTYTAEAGRDLSATGRADKGEVAYFVQNASKAVVKVDDSTVADDCYALTVNSDGTFALDFTSAFLATLSAGEHNVTVSLAGNTFGFVLVC